MSRGTPRRRAYVRVAVPCMRAKSSVLAHRRRRRQSGASCGDRQHRTDQTRRNCREKEAKSSTVALPAILVDELKAWRVQQAQELLRLGIRPNGETRVVTQPDGSSLPPRSLTHAISAFVKGRHSAGLHGLRQRHASHLLAENVHPKVVQERLGHSSMAITMDIYLHLMPNMQADTAAKVDAALTAAQSKKEA
jgi:integrase